LKAKETKTKTNERRTVFYEVLSPSLFLSLFLPLSLFPVGRQTGLDLQLRRGIASAGVTP
jgi:hypothetical protein